MPASRQRSRSPSMALAVIAMIGVRATWRSASMLRISGGLIPSMTGICMSIRMAEKRAWAKRFQRRAAILGQLDAIPRRWSSIKATF